MKNNYNYPMIVYPIRFYNGRIEWAAEFPDLPGCVGGGDTPSEAVDDAMLTLAYYLSELKEEGQELPKPTDFTADPSEIEELSVFFDKAMEEKLSKIAEDNEMTMNELIEVIIKSFVEESENGPEEKEEEDPVLDIKMNSDLFIKLQENAKNHGMDLETYIGYLLTKDAAGIIYPQQQAKFNRWDLG